MEHNGWRNLTLGAIAGADYGLVDGPFGSSLPASCYTVDGIPVVRGSNLSLGESRFKMGDIVFVSEETTNRLARSICVPDDIIFTKKGTLGQTGIIPRDTEFSKFLLSSNQMKLTVSKVVADPLFVYYYVSSPASREKIIRESTASGVPKINVAYLRQFPIKLPPLKEQQAIAYILGSLDDKLENNRQMNQTLEALARALFKSWFVDFDPVTAKAAGRKPYGINEATTALFPDRFVESQLGLIPEGWQTGHVSDFAKISSGKRPGNRAQTRTPEFNIPLFGGGGVMGYAEIPLFNSPILLTGRVGTLGEIFRITYPCWASDNTLVLMSKEQLFYEYLYFQLLDIDFQSLNRGSTQPLVSQGDLQKQSILIPSPEVLREFGRTTSRLFNRFDCNNDESDTLAALRDAVLPKLLSGEIRVQQIEKLVTEAL